MMKDTGKIVIFITTETEEEARRIADKLLNQRKVACVNIVPRVNSLYWWKGKIESASESLLIIKSKATQLPEIIKSVKEIHSYEVPEIIALPITGGNEDYLQWIDSEVEE